jgi:choline-sulfatase
MSNDNNRPSTQRRSNTRLEPGPESNHTAPGPVAVVLRALCAASLGAVVMVLVVAALEALRVAGDVPFGSAFLGILGLVTPLALGVGLAVGAFAVLCRVPLGSLWSALSRLDAQGPERARLFSARSAMLALGFGLWLVVAAALGVAALSSGGSVAPFALGLAFAACVAFGVAWRLAPLLAPRMPGPAKVWAITAVGSVVAWVWLLAKLGTPSGAGGNLALFGVLRREELDLGAPAYVLLLLLAAYQLPALLRRLPNWAAALACVVAVGCTWLSGRLLEEPTLALAVERKTALSGSSLKLLRRATDRDGDGFAGKFGGGDCNDSDARVNPTADETPGNGVDEDCSGGDESAAAPSAAEEPAAAPEPPKVTTLPKDLNVVFISVDTLRYDIGFTGYPRKITPNIDALAAKGTYFDRAYSLASYTSKSMGPLLIGRYGSETHHGELHFSIYPPIDKMLQERLGAAGVRTLSIQAHWYFKPNTGLGRGFDVLDMSAAPTERQGEGDRSVTSEQTSNAALKHLAELQNKPERFFMWVHYLDPHAEYVPHEGFDFGKDPRALYDGEVAYTDHHVGRVLDAIASGPLASRTAVIITSDHGEAFGEHGMTRHGFELWDVLVRVPLAIYVPGAKPNKLGLRRSAIDLAPTILELFGIERPAPGGQDFLSGTSLVSDVLMPEGYTPTERPIFIDMPGGPFVPERQAFIENDLKLITSKLRPMGLYDLAKDPDENQNLVKDVKTTSAALERMKAFRKRLRRAK